MWQRFRRARPVFIIGSYRSATSALTWALGQHPNLFPLEETHFLYKLAVDLENLYELGTSPEELSFLGVAKYTPREFRNYFGQACDRMVMEARERIARHSIEVALRDRSRVSGNVKLHRGWWQPKRRWIDGTPENAHFVLPLLRLFPEARFIHILRNPRRVATSLMHFSTMGAYDYAERDAYQTWTRLVHAAAMAEQVLGAGRVMRLSHEDLVADPREALARCLTFIGEKYHADCLMPLREKMNSSRYEDAGDCGVEANLASSSPWVREAFELYARLLEGRGPIDGGRPEARRRLRHELREYRVSLQPATNEHLSLDNASLRTQVEQLEHQCARLERRLARAGRPLEVMDWGPRDICAGIPFNPQPSSDNALWVSTRNAPFDTEIVLGETVLATDVHPGGNLVTATVPPHLTAQPRQLQLRLRSLDCGECTPPVTLEIGPTRGSLVPVA